MRWTLTDFGLERQGGLARPFQFEVIASPDAASESELLRGDGLLFTDGRVRFNREDSLRGFAQELGVDEQRFLSELCREIKGRAGAKGGGKIAVA